MLHVHPKKGSHVSPSQLALLSTSRNVAGSSPFLEQKVSLSTPISRLTWKYACPNCYSHMEIKLFLHWKKILYFPKSKNNHCNTHRRQAFRTEEHAAYNKQLSLVRRAFGQDEGLSMTLDRKHTKNSEKKEVGRRKARQPGAFKFNRLESQGRCLFSAVPAN